MSNQASQLYEFGPFRVDPRECLLLRDGEALALTPKAFETLVVLIQNAGHLMAKDELMKTLWPDSYVEEVNLSQNISILRKALGDTAQGSRYIVTVPGRGYRFTEKVRFVPQPDDIMLQSRSITHVVIEEENSPDKAWRLVGVAVAVVVVAALLGGTWYWRSHKVSKLTEKDSIVIADFANTTGDSVFDGTLRQGLSSQLEQSPFLNLLSDERVAQTLALMAQPKDARLTRELAREVCQRAAGAATIEGSISSLGSQYVVGLKAVNCRSGDVLANEQATASNKEQVLKALGEAAAKVRVKLGESLASVQKYDAPAENVTTPSLEALQAYGLGYRTEIVKRDNAAAIPLLQRAISLDPNFAMAYARLGTNYSNLGEIARGAENIRKAYELRERVSEREKFYIVSHYEHFVTGNLEAARKAYELWAQTYPRDDTPPGNLGVIYLALGNYDKALAANQEEVNLSPDGVSYTNLVFDYLSVNRLDEARATAQEAQAHHLDNPTIHLQLYNIDFLQHDAAGMEREAAALMGKPGFEDIMLDTESDTAAYAGQFSKARELTR